MNSGTRARARTTRAVVLGASMAGLLAARALSETFDQVVVVDRDDLAGTGYRKGAPQGRHAHGLLAKGREVLEEFFPGLTAELAGTGAIPVDLAREVSWFNGTREISRAPSRLEALAVSRPALEDYVRARIRALPNVDIRGGYEATGLLATGDCSAVTGVSLVRLGGDVAAELSADLVVDATGRGSRSAGWLACLGYREPAAETVTAKIVYGTRIYARSRPLPSGSVAAISAPSRTVPFGMVLLPMEDDRWILTLIGIGDDVPPTDVDGFNAFARRLPIPDLHDVIDGAEALTEPRRFRVPASIRRRYERLRRLPAGFLVIGDALCAFNPIYGQGMTVAAAEALVLRDCLRRSGDDLPRRFYRRAARVIDIPWDMAVGGDLAMPTSIGRRTLKIRVLNAYLVRVLRAAETDPAVSLVFHETINLMNRPERLFAPGMLRRVLFPGRPVAVADRTAGRDGDRVLVG